MRLIHREQWSGGIPGYGDALPDGQLAIFNPSKGVLVTSYANLPLPNGQPAQYPVLSPAGKIACIVGGQPDHAWEWDGRWNDVGPCCGMQAVAYDPDGRLYVAQCTPDLGPVGYRGWVNGRMVAGAEGYADPARGLYQFTDYGDVAIGQGDDNVGEGAVVRFADDGKLRRLATGTIRNIRARRAGDLFALTLVDYGRGETTVYHATLDELRALPVITPNTVPTTPPPVTPEPPKPMPPIADQTDVVKAVRAKYPTPLGETHAECLLEIARAIGQGAGLLRKDSGTNILLPDGTRVSQDVIVFPDGNGYDCLGSGETLATPQWGGPIEGSPFPASRYYAVSAPIPGIPAPIPGPPLPPPVDPDLVKRVERLESLLERLLAEGIVTAKHLTFKP